jgi:hypothetical protein
MFETNQRLWARTRCSSAAVPDLASAAEYLGAAIGSVSVFEIGILKVSCSRVVGTGD